MMDSEKLRIVGGRLIYGLKKLKKLPDYYDELGIWMITHLPVGDQKIMMEALSIDPNEAKNWLDRVLLDSGLYEIEKGVIQPTA